MAKPPLDPEDGRVPGLEKAFGEVLRRRRRVLNLTQEELAIETGLDRTFVSLLERGLRRPSLTTIFVLAMRFGCMPSTMIEEVEQRMSRG